MRSEMIAKMKLHIQADVRVGRKYAEKLNT
jgi:hypothetical protein